jgi:hypothetical protein
MLLSNPTYEKLVDMTESSRKNCYKDIAAIQVRCSPYRCVEHECLNISLSVRMRSFTLCCPYVPIIPLS